MLYSKVILDIASYLSENNYITNEQFTLLQSSIIPWLIIFHIVIHLGISMVMIFVSHRIAGPLERFKIVIQAFLYNVYFEHFFNIRNFDYFDDLIDSLNELIVKMRNDYLERQELITALSNAMQDNLSSSNKKTIGDLITKHQSAYKPK